MRRYVGYGEGRYVGFPACDFYPAPNRECVSYGEELKDSFEVSYMATQAGNGWVMRLLVQSFKPCRENNDVDDGAGDVFTWTTARTPTVNMTS